MTAPWRWLASRTGHCPGVPGHPIQRLARSAIDQQRFAGGCPARNGSRRRAAQRDRPAVAMLWPARQPQRHQQYRRHFRITTLFLPCSRPRVPMLRFNSGGAHVTSSDRREEAAQRSVKLKEVYSACQSSSAPRQQIEDARVPPNITADVPVVFPALTTAQWCRQSRSWSSH